nr:peroxisomal nicotinamide adenine dinucleotide carrier isoform X1 [Arachis hypogaea]
MCISLFDLSTSACSSPCVAAFLSSILPQLCRNKAEVAALEQKRLGIGDGSVGMFSLLIVAIFSVCVNVLLTNPIWVVVMRMQTHRKESSRTLSGDVLLNATEQALVPAVEPLAYGTSDVVGKVYLYG